MTDDAVEADYERRVARATEALLALPDGMLYADARHRLIDEGHDGDAVRTAMVRAIYRGDVNMSTDRRLRRR